MRCRLLHALAILVGQAARSGLSLTARGKKKTLFHTSKSAPLEYAPSAEGGGRLVDIR